MKRITYHTQRKEEERLKCPVICKRRDAWLGHGYYFWIDEKDAIQWGHDSKRDTGWFEIYNAEINYDNILDTVFNEEHYHLFLKQIEKIAEDCFQKTGRFPDKKDICYELTYKVKWIDVIDGIQFADTPLGSNCLINGLPYRKRIQIAIYKLSCMSNFIFHAEFKCKRK